VLAEHGDRNEPRFIQKTPRLGRISVDELGAKLQRHARIRAVERENPPAHARARFEHDHLLTRPPELTRANQSGRPGPDYYCIGNQHRSNLGAPGRNNIVNSAGLGFRSSARNTHRRGPRCSSAMRALSLIGRGYADQVARP
jgi:hypothetical protein